MLKTRLKLGLWIVVIGFVAAGVWLALTGLGSLLAYFQRGADPASALNIVPNVPPDLHVTVDWLPDDSDTGREMEPFTRAQVEAAYLRAWLQWNISYLRNEPYGLKTYFVGPALDSVSTAVRSAATQGINIRQVDTSHSLKLHLYSADGSIISFTDTRAQIAQTIRDADGNELFAGETQASYDVVMFLSDGTWRVRHWVRTDGTAFDNGLPRTSLQTRPGFVGRRGTQLVLNDQPYAITGINYYPQATPWHEFWPNYDPSIIEQDFARIQSLGINTVRIFVQFEEFGGPIVNPARLEQLNDLLNRADTHGLKVIVTLFDFRTDYSLLLWPNADRHLETLLTRFKDHQAILAWDLKNEPDRDYQTTGRQTVNAWLVHTARMARAYDPHHLLTIGWSTPEAAHNLPDAVDVVSFHYYAPATEFLEQYRRLREHAPAQPIFVSEFGLPTWNSFFFPNGHSQPEQAMYFADMLSLMRTTDITGHAAWTLYDFNQIPAQVAGRWPWQTQPQKHLGILERNGDPKPAAALLAPDVSLNVARVPAWARFLKPFWLTMLTFGIAAPLFVRWLWTRRKTAVTTPGRALGTGRSNE